MLTSVKESDEKDEDRELAIEYAEVTDDLDEIYLLELCGQKPGWSEF